MRKSVLKRMRELKSLKAKVVTGACSEAQLYSQCKEIAWVFCRLLNFAHKEWVP